MSVHVPHACPAPVEGMDTLALKLDVWVLLKRPGLNHTASL